MAENTDDKHIDSQVKTELEHSPKKNISSDEPEIIIQTKEIFVIGVKFWWLMFKIF